MQLSYREPLPAEFQLDCHSVQLGQTTTEDGFAAWRIDSRAVLVRINTDLDGQTISSLRAFLDTHSPSWHHVILDFSPAHFVGVPCLALFEELNRRAVLGAFRWSAIGSHPLHRLLRAARAEDEHPVADSIEGALRATAPTPER